MLKPIRRVVTGHNAQGKSVIVTDGPSPHILTIPGVPTFGMTNLWVTDGTPADNTGAGDAAARPVVLEPPASGTIFRVVEFPPDHTLAGFDRTTAFESMGAGHAMDRDASRHPGMHKTATRMNATRQGPALRLLQAWFVPRCTRTSPARRSVSPSSSRAQISPLRTIA